MTKTLPHKKPYYVDPNPTVSIESPTDSPTDSPSYPWEMENAHFYGLRNLDISRQHERVLFIVQGVVEENFNELLEATKEREHIDDAVAIWKVNHFDGGT